MVETLCTSGAVQFKAGTNSETLTSGAYTTIINQAEGDLFIDTGVDWVDKFSGLSAKVKGTIEGACSNKAAIYAINKNIDAIGRGTSTLMTNILSWAYDKAVLRLRLDNIKKKFGVT